MNSEDSIAGIHAQRGRLSQTYSLLYYLLIRRLKFPDSEVIFETSEDASFYYIMNDSDKKIEELIQDLKTKFTIIIVTHNMQQAARVSDETAFFYIGDLIEINSTETIFTKPDKEMTENYITGKFG